MFKTHKRHVSIFPPRHHRELPCALGLYHRDLLAHTGSLHLFRHALGQVDGAQKKKPIMPPKLQLTV